MAETDQTEIEEQLAVWEARGDGKTAEEEPRRRAKVIQLPLWPEPKRGAPNAVLRGALFAAIHKDRRYMERELAGRPGQGIERSVSPAGSSSQSELDVWEQVLHLARTQAARLGGVISRRGACSSPWAARRGKATTNGSSWWWPG